jgi:glutathione S-transferase
MSEPIVVRGLPGIWGAPSPSPFVIKLLTWMRMAGIEHRLAPLLGLPRSTTRKMPYVELPSGEIVADSAIIMARLAKDRGIDLDVGLDEMGRAMTQLLTCTIEEHLYFCGLYARFATREGWAHTSRDYFAHMAFPARIVAPFLVRRIAMKNLHGQGTGRLPRATVEERARRDLHALSTVLGDKPYFLGDQPRSVDATALGILWAISCVPFESAAKSAVEGHPNLVAYVSRMRARYWDDFD